MKQKTLVFEGLSLVEIKLWYSGHKLLVESVKHWNWRHCSQKAYVFLSFVEEYVRLEYAWMCLNKQDSEYASGPKYAKILNMAGLSICEGYTVLWIFHNMAWQSSEYISGSKYSSVLNMQGLHRVLNMPQYVWIFDNRQGSEFVSCNTCCEDSLQVNGNLLRDRRI